MYMMNQTASFPTILDEALNVTSAIKNLLFWSIFIFLLVIHLLYSSLNITYRTIFETNVSKMKHVAVLNLKGSIRTCWFMFLTQFTHIIAKVILNHIS